MVFGLLFLLAVTMLLLIKGADWVVRAFGEVVTILHLNSLFFAMVVVALSTSLPELFVGIVSSVEGVPQLSWGNVLGSNVANVSLVIGMAAMMAGSIAVVGDYAREELLVALITGGLPALLLIDGSMTREDGIFLLIIYIWYLRKMAVSGETKKRIMMGNRSIWMRMKKAGWNRLSRPVLMMVLGLLFLAIGAQVIVEVVTRLSGLLNLPILGLGILTALGTVVPELVLSYEAIKKKEVSLVLGNLMGSIVTNAALVLGLTAVISPVSLNSNLTYNFAAIGFIFVFGLFWLFTKTKKKLDRWEGVCLIGVYLMFVGFQLLLK